MVPFKNLEYQVNLGNSSRERETLLCVANFPSNTGYAWNFIESIYARVADRFHSRGIRTFVAYPKIASAPKTLQGSAAEPIELDAGFGTAESVEATLAFVRKENVRVAYFTDRETWDPVFVRLRGAGVGRIVVHDHASGERTAPRGLKRAAKWLLARAPWINADAVLTVSDYVARRQMTVGLVPRGKVRRVWNGVPIPKAVAGAGLEVRREWGLAPETPLVVCACRASPEKGVPHLLRAFDLALRGRADGGPRPALIYAGDGPQLARLQELRDALRSKDRVFMAGHRSDVPRILQSADLCVVPSVIQDAFPLSVLEPMAMGKPVIASAVGGIVEIIEDGASGILVAPGDEEALAGAIARVLDDPMRACNLGAAARERVAKCCDPDEMISSVVAVLEPGFP